MTETFKKWEKTFTVYYKNSVFGKLCDKAASALHWLCAGSGLCDLMQEDALQKSVKNSGAYMGIGKAFAAFYTFSYQWGQKITQRSRLIGTIGQLVRFVEYGAAVFYNYLQDSYLWKIAHWNKNWNKNIKKEKLQRPKAVPFPTAGVALLLVLLLVSLAVLGLVKGLMLFCGIIFAIALISRPQIGIYSAVALAPFFPTMALAGLLLATGGCFLLQLLFGKGYRFKIDATGIFLLLFAVLLVFYGLTSYSPGKSLQIALLEVLFIGSYFLIIAMIQNRIAIKNMIFVYCTSSLVTGLIGLYQFLSGKIDVTWTDTTLFEEIGLRVYSTFDNPNVYGEYLLLALPIAIVMVFLAKGLVAKGYYAGISAILLVNLGLTYSRGCYLALMLAAFIFILCNARQLLLLGIPALAVMPFVLPSSIIARFASITNMTDTSTSYRLNIWQGAVRMLKDFWYLGIGLGQDAFNSVYPKYSLNGIVAPHSHNLYLQVFLEMGIAGFFTFTAVMVCFTNGCILGMKKAKKAEKMLIAAILSAVVAFLFQGVFDYVWYNYRVFLLFFMTIGIGSVICSSVERGEDLF